MSERKIIKFQLPEIYISDDVEMINIETLDGKSRYHNAAGPSRRVIVKDIGGRLVEDPRLTKYCVNCTYYSTKEDFERAIQPPKEMTVEEVEKLLGYKVKIVGDKNK